MDRFDFANFYNFDKKEITKILDNTSIPLLDNDRITFLKNRPWWNKVHDNFQSCLDEMFPGTHLVADPFDVDDLLNINTIMIPNSNYQIKQMERSMCHDNSIKLCTTDSSLKLFSGYALSDDKLWRHHSWVMTKTDDIIETTEKRLIYLGYNVDRYKTINTIKKINFFPTLTIDETKHKKIMNMSIGEYFTQDE
jgi:hypothetical protein